ncbi:hypothetical protein THAOC_36855, partial [Thalassiosira oceanica]
GLQLHDGPPGPPRFPQELDDSLAKKVEKERAAFPALEDRLRHEDIGSGKRAAHETRGSSNAGDSTAAPMVQREVIQGGETVSTIHSMNEDDPPIPVLQVVDQEKSEGNQARRVANEFGRSSDHPRYNVPTVHTTMGASVASAAEVDPSVVGSNTSTNTTSPGAAGRAATNSGATTAIVGTRTIVLPQAMMIKPGDDDDPEPVTAEPVTPAVLPFYRRKGFVYVMVAMALLAVGITAAVLIPSNVKGSTDREETLTVTNNPAVSNISTDNRTNSPTNNPTASNKPTTSRASPLCGGSLMMIQIQYDSYSEETSYKLEKMASDDGQETELASHSGSAGDKNHEESICLGDGLYSFSFYDSYGDGFNGEYSLTLVPGETIIKQDNSESLYGEQVLFRLPFDRATVDVRWMSLSPSSSPTLTLSPSSSSQPSSSASPSNNPTASNVPTTTPSLLPTENPTLQPTNYVSATFDALPRRLRSHPVLCPSQVLLRLPRAAVS